METQSKIKEAMLYIAKRHVNDVTFGKTRLFKELFWADAIHYAMTGKTITGSEYKKLPNGPVPVNGMAAFDELIQSGRATLRQVPTPYSSRQQILGEPTMDVFTPDEVARLDDICDWGGGQYATQVSEHSHDFSPWKWALDGEVIEMDAIFIDENRPLSDTARAKILDRIEAGAC